MLRRLELRSFKVYEKADVRLEPFTVLVGTNGSGKTSLLQAVEFMAALVDGTIDDALQSRNWGYSDLPNKLSARRGFGFSAHLDLNDRRYVWSIDVHRRRGNYIARESVKVDRSLVMDRNGRDMRRRDATTGEWGGITQSLPSSWLSTVDDEDEERFPHLVALAAWARGVQPYLELSPTMLRLPSRRTSVGIGPAGEHLAGFLRHLADDEPAAYHELVSRVRRHYRHLDRVILRAPRAGWNRLEVVERWGTEPITLSSDQVSDGFLRLCAIGAMAYMQPRPSLLMVDEVENGVHPRLLGGLIGLLRDLAGQGTQVLVSTHSPIALNAVEDPNAILIVQRMTSGRARVKRLSDTQGYKALRSVFRPGELWVNVGEQKLIRRPRPRKSSA